MSATETKKKEERIYMKSTGRRGDENLRMLGADNSKNAEEERENMSKIVLIVINNTICIATYYFTYG